MILFNWIFRNHCPFCGNIPKMIEHDCVNGDTFKCDKCKTIYIISR